jgi:hypothetical protein
MSHISYDGELYTAQCSDEHGNCTLKSCNTLQEALVWYSVEKKRVVRQQIMRDLYTGLISFTTATELMRRGF